MRYEIREIDVRENRRVAIYTADEIEIKKDDYGVYEYRGDKVGFKIEGKNRKTWIHPVQTAVQIIDRKTNDVIYLKSNIEILEEAGRQDLLEKWF